MKQGRKWLLVLGRKSRGDWHAGQTSPYALRMSLLCGFHMASLWLPCGWLPRGVDKFSRSSSKICWLSGDLLVRTPASQLSRLEELGSPFSPLALSSLHFVLTPLGVHFVLTPLGVDFVLTPLGVHFVLTR